jgi:hypothetical protein
MSAVLSELGGVVSSVLSNVLTVIPQGNIGGIAVPVTLEETSTDLVTVTDHPVEAGAQITDHAYYRPAELTMRCGWSNSSSFTLQSAASSLFSGGGISAFASTLFGQNPPTSGGGMSVSDFVSGIYSQLLNLQQSLVPFTVVTSIRLYTNMILTSLVVTRDKKTSQALMVTASMRQVILVSTVSTTLAAIGNQANPASTAEQLNTGPQNLIPNATPNPGGSFPPSAWPVGSDEALIAQATQ